MSYTVQEKLGIIDLLQSERKNVNILYQLANSVTKNVINAETEQGKMLKSFIRVNNKLRVFLYLPNRCSGHYIRSYTRLHYAFK